MEGRTDQPSLPAFIEPMLAKSGDPFDSDEYLFEIKWDGTRAIAYVEGRKCRLMNRRRFDISDRYPELQCFAGAPDGTVLDGEIVVLRDGRSDFQALEQRDQARSSFKINQMARSMPATYIAFDQLYDRFESVMGRTCSERRTLARQTVAGLASAQIIMSEGIVGAGIDYFQRVSAEGMEGVIAKRLDSLYLPGKRTDAWVKIKRQQLVPCVVVGFLEDDLGDLRSLILASEENGALRYVGRVGSGIDEALRTRLLDLLKPLARNDAVVQCRVKGKWVEPEIYCLVRCMERTPDGHLRAPVLERLL